MEVTLVKLIEQKQANQFFTIFTNLFEFFKANEASRPMNLLYVCTRYLISVCYKMKYQCYIRGEYHHLFLLVYFSHRLA